MSTLLNEQVRVYEQDSLRQVTGEAIRPGGLELTERALSLCGLPPGARVLDVGCGACATIEHLITHHGLYATGVDPSSHLLQEGRMRNAHLPLLQATGERLPLASNSMDAVLAECTLSLMADMNRALAECHRVLRPGGLLAATDLYARRPDGAPALHRLPLCSCLSGALPRRELLDRLQAHSFEILLWEDHSNALKRFAAQLILTHGSMENFWCGMLPPETGAEEIRQAIAAAHPSYFLLIARALA
jgi:arsenite methyltransferase